MKVVMRIVPIAMSALSVALAQVACAQMLSTNDVDPVKWGAVVAPSYGTSETSGNGVYSSAELFAGPNKFGQYFAGVLPNGKFVRPAGVSAQVGMNPLGIAVTPDGKYLLTTNDDEREGGLASYAPGGALNKGGYSISVVDTASMSVVSTYQGGTFFIGLQVSANPAGGYTLWASGGPGNDVKQLALSATGTIRLVKSIPIAPTLSATVGYVSNYTPAAALNATVGTTGFKPPVPSAFNRTAGARITFPAGMTLSPDGKVLYVACNGDNSVAAIDTASGTVLAQAAVGFFPYTVAVSADGKEIAVSNWGTSAYKFKNANYDAAGNLSTLGFANADPIPPAPRRSRCWASAPTPTAS
jgi:YVTN family beta-propeller protein